MDQFEDADEYTQSHTSTQPVFAAPQVPIVDFTTAREFPRVDDVAYADASEDDDDDDEEEDDYWDEDDEAEYRAEHGLRAGFNEVMDQDWADASGDFTKRYNRMRQQVVATHAGASSGSASSPLDPSTADSTARPGNVIPAMNRPKASAAQKRAAAAAAAEGRTGSSSAPGVHTNKVSDQLAHYSRYASQITLEPLYPTSGQASRKGGSEKILIKDKADRATNEQVLDPRTRLILFKMLGRGLIERIDGCVSTGKEANVYHALTPEQRHFALKIYKTSILVFKDRDRYVTGEFRFKSGYARSNPRKMVRLWAEKEMRNLRRMKGAGMRVPEAIEVRENVLVMEFMGKDEWQASPRLKDAQIPAEDVRRLYIEILVILRTIFARCKLVHADFSEYNILYHEGHLWVIDVSQSVEQDHPAAFDFLRSDIKNADDFFNRRGIDTLGLTRTFNFVTRSSWIKDRAETDEDIQVEAERLVTLVEQDALAEEPELETSFNGQSSKTTSKSANDGTGSTSTRPSASDEAVFAQSYIPRALDQVYDIERDVAKVLKGEGNDLIYADITGVADIQKREVSSSVRFSEDPSASAKGKLGNDARVSSPLKGQVVAGPGTGKSNDVGDEPDFEQEGEEGEDDSVEDDEDADSDVSGSESDSEDGTRERKPKGKKFEDKEDKKKRRQETKEKAREKRTQKMKKSEKARRMKKSSGKK